MFEDPGTIQSPRRQATEGLRPSLAEALSWLIAGWRLIAAVTLLGAALAYGFSLLIPQRYEATTSLFIDSRSIQPLATGAGQGSGGDNNAEVSFVESQAKIITSQRVLARVVASQHLSDDPEFSGVGSPSALDTLQKLVGSAPAQSSDSARSRAAQVALADQITVRRAERTFVIDVAVRARAPDKAARLANAIAQAFLDEQAAAHAEMARHASEALTGRLDELRQRTKLAEERVQAFKDQHGLIGTRLQLSSEQQLTEANAQLALARAQAVNARARLDKLSGAATRDVPDSDTPDGDTPEATSSPTVTLLRGKQADARRQLASILAQFGPRYPAVRDARDQLADLNRSIQSELRRIGQAARIELRRSIAAESAARAIVDRLSGEAADTSNALSQLAQLQQEVDIDKGLLNTVLSRAQETGEMERLDSTLARVISTAEPPLHRVYPPRGIVFVVFGSVLGFWCAAGHVLLDRLGWIAALRQARGRSTFYCAAAGGPEVPSAPDRRSAVATRGYVTRP